MAVAARAVGLLYRHRPSQSSYGRHAQALEYDETSEDARRQLLLALMDGGDAAAARALVERFPEDDGAVFGWTAALVEHISFALLQVVCRPIAPAPRHSPPSTGLNLACGPSALLQEEGSTEEEAVEALGKAFRVNPHVGICLAYHEASRRCAHQDARAVSRIRCGASRGPLAPGSARASVETDARGLAAQPARRGIARCAARWRCPGLRSDRRPGSRRQPPR